MRECTLQNNEYDSRMSLDEDLTDRPAMCHNLEEKNTDFELLTKDGQHLKKGNFDILSSSQFQIRNGLFTKLHITRAPNATLRLCTAAKMMTIRHLVQFIPKLTSVKNSIFSYYIR